MLRTERNVLTSRTDMQLMALTKFMTSQSTIQKVYLLNQDYAFGQSVSKGSRDQLNARRPDLAVEN